MGVPSGGVQPTPGWCPCCLTVGDCVVDRARLPVFAPAIGGLKGPRLCVYAANYVAHVELLLLHAYTACHSADGLST